MMPGKGKGMSALLIAAGPPKLDKGRDMPLKEGLGDGSPEERAAARFGGAVKGGDGKAILAAYKALKEAGEAGGDEGGEAADYGEGSEGEA